MTTFLMPVPKQQYNGNGGHPLNGGKVYTYATGTSTPKQTFTDSAGTIPQANPIILNARGEPDNAIFWSGSYRVEIRDSLGNLIYTVDNYNTDPAGLGNIFATLLASGGSALIGWVRSVTGAVVTTVSKWLGWHTPIIFEFMTDAEIAAVQSGAGAVEVTTAVQKALTGCSGAIFPPGTYLCGKLSVTRNFTFYGETGAKLLHKAAATTALIESKSDYTVILRNMEVDGNYANQTAAVGSYNMIWNSIGSMKFYDCYVHGSRGHLFRSGNIDDFNAASFAHDVVIEGSDFVNPTATSGDCVRVERTRGYRVRNSSSYGGFSGFRTQLYCRDVEFENVKSTYAYADCGITVAMSWRVRVNNCEGAYNALQGLEIDSVVNYRGSGNSWHHNSRSGIFSTEYGAADYTNSPTYAGSIAEGFGIDYSNQTFASPRVSSLDAVFGPDRSTDNTHADRFIGQTSGTVYIDNFLNNPSLGGGYVAQLSIEGGVLNKTGVRVIRPTFVPGSADTYCIQQSNYQFDGYVTGAVVIGNKRLAQYCAVGMFDLNQINRYLADSTKRSALLLDVADSTSITGGAISHTTAGDQTYSFTGPRGTGQGEKMVRFVARAAAGPQTAYIAVNLYDSAGVYVATIQGETAISLTTTYQEFAIRVPASASIGSDLRPQIRVPVAGVTLFLQEMNLYTSAA